MPAEELLPENVDEYLMLERQSYSVKCQAKAAPVDVHYDLRSVLLKYLGRVGHASGANKVARYSPYHFGLSLRENIGGLRF